MKKNKRKYLRIIAPRILLVILLFGILSGGWLFYVLFVSSEFGYAWPTIDNEEQLVNDCMLLYFQAPNESMIPETLWPESIKKLHPVFVWKFRSFITVTISTGGIGPGWGYIINGLPDALAYELETIPHERTGYPGIYKYSGLE